MHSRQDRLGVLVIKVILCCFEVCDKVMAQLSSKA